MNTETGMNASKPNQNTTNTMEIISANLLDINTLRIFEKICFAQDAWPLFDLIAVLSLSGVVRLKAVEQNRMIGFVAGDPRPGEGFSWVSTLAVLPEYRGRGIGRALLEACEKQLPTQRVHLSVRPSNEEAIRMYKFSGYYVIDRWKKYYNDGEDAIVMEKLK
jgi:ribosomal-protein-alanine N-acetyltransferase